MKQLFMFGRNGELSFAELESYFSKEGISAQLIFKTEKSAIFEIEQINLKKAISQLGGIIAIGKTIFSGTLEEIENYIAKNLIYFGKDNKISYTIIDLADEGTYDIVCKAVNDNFRKDRLKARFSLPRGMIKSQDKDVIHGSPTKLMNKEMVYFIANEQGKMKHFGILEEIYDSREAERRDMDKPVRRESLSIAPRLAKTMINLAQVKENGLLLDPFCGVGSILQEALLHGINTVGIDKDTAAILDAKRNIEWLKQNYKIDNKCELINFDSRKALVKNKVDGIACEPSLGEILRSPPSEQRARQMLGQFEQLMIYTLRNFRKNMGKGMKVVFSSPYTKTSRNVRMGADIDKIAMETGLIFEKSIKEFRDEQIVGREIVVLRN